jgi:hypothetical protein
MYSKGNKVSKNEEKVVKKEIYNIKLENINKMINFLKRQNKK